MNFADPFAAAFEQWKADFDADPDSFMPYPEFCSEPPKSYGESASRTLLRYLTEDGVDYAGALSRVLALIPPDGTEDGANATYAAGSRDMLAEVHAAIAGPDGGRS